MTSEIIKKIVTDLHVAGSFSAPSANRAPRDYRNNHVGVLERVGADVSRLAELDELIVTSSLDWAVESREVLVRSPDGSARVAQNHRALVRSDTEEVFAFASPGYVPAQNREMVAAFLRGLTEAGLRFERMGSALGGRLVFATARVSTVDIVTGDPVEMKLLLTNGHNGAASLAVAVTFNRLYCANQLPSLMASGEAVKIRHNSKAISDIAAIGDRIRRTIEAGKSDTDAFRLLARTPASETRVISLLDTTYGAIDKNSNKSERVKRESILSLFHGGGAGLHVPGVKGTMWAAYNAVTEFEDHKSARGTPENLLWGAAGDRKKAALRAAMQLCRS